MNSCLYECSVMHHRLAPKVHHFRHDLFMFYLDLDELEELSRKILLFNHNRKNIYSFDDGDHEPAGPGTLKERIVSFLKQHGIELATPQIRSDADGARVCDPQHVTCKTAAEEKLDQPLSLKCRDSQNRAPHSGGRVMLLTLPRICGYIFNPISIYYCFDEAGVPVATVVEVGNTFREMKLYLLRLEDLADDGRFEKIVPKHFYVSPFSSLELSFDFRLRIPAEQLEIKIDDRDGANKVLVSTLAGLRTDLSNRNLAWFTLKYPLVTLKVMFLIHWHAFRLWVKRVPFARKAANASLQREVLRPHPTLATKTK